MYLGWTIIYAGLGCLLNTVWLLLLLPMVAVATRRCVRREERTLERTIGAEYRNYRRRVPRYLYVATRHG